MKTYTSPTLLLGVQNDFYLNLAWATLSTRLVSAERFGAKRSAPGATNPTEGCAGPKRWLEFRQGPRTGRRAGGTAGRSGAGKASLRSTGLAAPSAPGCGEDGPPRATKSHRKKVAVSEMGRAT